MFTYDTGWILAPLLGGQLYSKPTLSAGKLYTFNFTPSFPYARIYLFSGPCTMAQITAGGDGRALPGDGGPGDGVAPDTSTPVAYRCPPKPKYFCLSGRVFLAEDMARKWV